MCQRKKWFLHGLLFVMVMFILTGWCGEVQSQPKYPTRGIDIIVPFTPGGATDLVIRVMAVYLKQKWSVPVNVINKPGGNTVPACLEVHRAAPDGYILLGDNNPSSSMLPIVVKSLPFKVMDRTFISMVAGSPAVIIVPYDSQVKTLKDLEIEIKKDPENFTWASLGGTGLPDYVTRQFLKTIGVDVLRTKPVMCQGGAQAVILTAGGHIKMGSGTVSASTPAITGNTVTPLAITSKTRWPDLPNLPTAVEAGYPTVNYLYWVGFSGPPNLPPDIIDKWDKTLQEILKDPEVISKLKNIGAIPFYQNARGNRKYVMEEIEEASKLWDLK